WRHRPDRHDVADRDLFMAVEVKCRPRIAPGLAPHLVVIAEHAIDLGRACATASLVTAQLLMTMVSVSPAPSASRAITSDSKALRRQPKVTISTGAGANSFTSPRLRGEVGLHAMQSG